MDQERFKLEGWDWEHDVLPAFKELEDDPAGAEVSPEYHGIGGKIPIYRTVRSLRCYPQFQVRSLSIATLTQSGAM